MIPKLILSAVAVILISWVGGVIFFVNPLNWRTDMNWLNWPMLLSNTAIVAGVMLGWWFALRRVWRRSKKAPDQPPEPAAALAPGRGSA